MDLQTAHANLVALPSHGAIHDFLKARNIKGTPFHAECCPIANYLKSGTCYSVKVTKAGIVIAEGKQPDLSVTLAITDFMTLFDFRKLPDLIDT